MTRPAFDDRVAAYARSPSHRAGASLELSIELASLRPGHLALDVSTGTGFTAHALTKAGAHVVAADLAPNMLRHTLAESPVALHGVLTDTHRLALSGGAFDVLTCRHAFHHYVDGAAALAEMGRVVRPNGRVVVADTVAPDDAQVAATMHAVERARDPSHVRNWTAAELHDGFQNAGLSVVRTASAWTEQTFEGWCDRTGVARDLRERLWARLVDDPAVRRAFRVRTEDGERRFAWPVLVITGRARV